MVQKNDVTDDVRKILAHRCKMYPEYFTLDDTWQCCVKAIFMYATPHRLHRFVGDLFTPRMEEQKPFFSFDTACNIERAIRNALSVLNELQVMDGTKTVLNLGKPDSTILPLIDDFEERWVSLNCTSKEG